MNTYLYPTPIGAGYLQADDNEVVTIFLPGTPRPGKLEKAPPDGAVTELLIFLESYFRGEERGRGPGISSLLEKSAMTGFTRRVMEEVAAIPYGETRSYGEIADAAGSPRAARGVGNIMARNPFPVLIPCHRVIKSTGEPGGFGGNSGLKVWMLELESRPLC